MTPTSFCLFSLLLVATTVSSIKEDHDGVCEGKGCRKDSDTGISNAWVPFHVTTEDKWISFDRLAEKYSEWHESALQNDELQCQYKKIVVFTPNAGLGDSVGALTAGYLYSLRAGRLFFIDWKPYPWSVMFKGLPFRYKYREVLKMKTKLGKPLICPAKDDSSSYLHGHITSEHPLTKEAEGHDFPTNYDAIIKYFLQPAAKVEAIMKDIVNGPFHNSNLEENRVLHKVALVMRTGIGEYNQFLSPGDEKTFVTCFNNYAVQYQQKMGKHRVKFVVFVTSDVKETKANAVEALQSNPHGLEIEVVTLNDSAIHIMHLSKEESKKTKIQEKLRKTIAEFFLIGMCDARFLTHGSLFGKSAAERGGGNENLNFFISDSNCDGKRQKYSYLKCHEPKYPKICNFS